MKQRNRIRRNVLFFYRDQSGVVVVLVAVLLTVFLGVVALAVDVGHLSVVKNELQNAADAAALWGANNFYLQGSSGGPTEPNWNNAEIEAKSAIALNKSDARMLTRCDVLSGYWNLAHNPEGLQSKYITPKPNDFPAVQVTVRRAAGSNGGPVRNWFAGVLGKATSNMSATATAVCGQPPHSINPVNPVNPDKSPIIPMAVSQWMIDRYFSRDPYVSFRMGAMTGNWQGQPDDLNDSFSGWTTFTGNPPSSNLVGNITDLIRTGSQEQLSVGDNIWLQPWKPATNDQGTNNNNNGDNTPEDPGLRLPGLFDEVRRLYKGQTILVPIVSDYFEGMPQVPDNFDPFFSAEDRSSEMRQIIGFAPIYIEDVVPGDPGNRPNPGYILAHFASPLYMGGRGPIGGDPIGNPNWGRFLFSPPRLVK